MTAQIIELQKDMIITLDGPAASGKSSVAKVLAKHLGIAFISSGLLYRAVAHVTLQDHIPPQDEPLVLKTLAKYRIKIFPNSNGNNQIYLNNKDATSHLHTDVIDELVSTVAKHPNVRSWVNERLGEMTGSFVIEGRDMGSTVFPKAGHKFYMIASPEVRAKRRLDERETNLEEVLKAILERDNKDAKQLKPAEDAVHIDTNDLNIEQVVEIILNHITNNHV